MASELTLIIGPQTSLALDLNAVIRTRRSDLAAGGIKALPSRVSSPFLRRCLDRERSLEDRRAEFLGETKGATVLSAVNFLGPPQAGLRRREMFPDAEGALRGLAEIADGANIVLVSDALPQFFLAAGSEALEARVRGTGWETLYELSWSDLAHEITESLPQSHLFVLTPDGAAARSPIVLERLFGEASDTLDPYALLRARMSTPGQAVLDRMLEGGPVEEVRSAELFTSFATSPDMDTFSERLGLDKITVTLLEQRYSEDLDAIRALPRTEVI